MSQVRRRLRHLPLLSCLFLALLIALNGCAARLKKAAVSSFIEDVAKATAKQDDVALVAQALPTYLLLVEGLLESNPNDLELLTTAAQLYATCASIVEGDAPKRAQSLYARARSFGLRALATDNEVGGLIDAPYVEFEQIGGKLGSNDLPAVFWAASAWGAWISGNTGSMAALAELPKVIYLMEWVLKEDETYFAGSPHLFLGMYHAARPPLLGGQPDKALEHFDAAAAISEGQSLMVPVQKARFYARQTFDRELYETLLHHTLEQPLGEGEFRLQNATAKIMARQLLKDVDAYF